MTSSCRAMSIYIAAQIRVKFENDEPTTKCFSSTNGQSIYGGGGGAPYWGVPPYHWVCVIRVSLTHSFRYNPHPALINICTHVTTYSGLYQMGENTMQSKYVKLDVQIHIFVYSKSMLYHLLIISPSTALTT
jgi:hypothetical protein